MRKRPSDTSEPKSTSTSLAKGPMAQSARRCGLIGVAANPLRRRIRGFPAVAGSLVTLHAGSGERVPQDCGLLLGRLEAVLISPEPQC